MTDDTPEASRPGCRFSGSDESDHGDERVFPDYGPCLRPPPAEIRVRQCPGPDLDGSVRKVTKNRLKQLSGRDLGLVTKAAGARRHRESTDAPWRGGTGAVSWRTQTKNAGES